MNKTAGKKISNVNKIQFKLNCVLSRAKVFSHEVAHKRTIALNFDY